MTSISWDDDDGVSIGSSVMTWKGRNHFNFIAGRSKLRALPVILHLLPEDIDWFAKDQSLFYELKVLLRDQVIATTNNGERDAEAPKSRKRARKEELCIHGVHLQFTYRYRKTLPRYTVLSYNGDMNKDMDGVLQRTAASRNSFGASFRHLPLSDSTLLVWVYRFDAEDPYRAVPNEAALHFAPKKKAPIGPVDLEATGKIPNSDSVTGEQGASARDTGLLRWLWGWDRAGESDNHSGRGGVRQHFLGSAAWQGRPPEVRGLDQEEADLKRAIKLSLAESGSGSGRGAGAADVVEVLGTDKGEETEVTY